MIEDRGWAIKYAVRSPEYLAALFDGEGCVSVNKAGTLTVGIQMVYQPLLLGLCCEFGGSLSYMQGKKKPYWQWNITGRDALRFLSIIQDYSIVKYSEVKEALRYSYCMVGKGGIRSDEQHDVVTDIRRKLQLMKQVYYEKAETVPTSTEEL